jgi:hypothetical protein
MKNKEGGKKKERYRLSAMAGVLASSTPPDRERKLWG